MPTMLEFKLDYDVFWRLTGAQRLPIAALHTLLSIILLVQAGALWHAHMRAGWRKKSNRWSGSAIVLGLILLLFSGLGLFYFGSELLQLWSALLHTAVGFGASAVLCLHIAMGKKINRLRNASHH